MKKYVFVFCFLVFSIFVSEVDASSKKNKTFKYDLSAVLLFQNQAPYLREWIEYHRM